MICWLKWLLGGIAAPLTLLLGVAAILLAMFGVFALPFMAREALHHVWAQYAPRSWRLTAVAASDVYRDIRWRMARGERLGVAVFYALLLALICWGMAPFGVKLFFGCDECLPEGMRQQCAASLTDMVAKDRTDLERICAAHPEWCEAVP